MTTINISGTSSNSNIILNSGSAYIEKIYPADAPAPAPAVVNSLLDFSGIDLVGVGTWKEYLLSGAETVNGIAERKFYLQYDDSSNGIPQKQLYIGDGKIGTTVGDGALLTPKQVILEYFKTPSLIPIMYPPAVYVTPATGEELSYNTFAQGILDASKNVIASFTSSYYSIYDPPLTIKTPQIDLTASGLGIINPEFSYSEAKCNFATISGEEYDITYVKITSGNDDFKTVAPSFFGDSFENIKNKWIRFTPRYPYGLTGLFKKTSTNTIITKQMIIDSPFRIPMDLPIPMPLAPPNPFIDQTIIKSKNDCMNKLAEIYDISSYNFITPYKMSAISFTNDISNTLTFDTSSSYGVLIVDPSAGTFIHSHPMLQYSSTYNIFNTTKDGSNNIYLYGQKTTLAMTGTTSYIYPLTNDGLQEIIIVKINSELTYMNAVKGFYGIARSLPDTSANNITYKTDYVDYIHWLTTSDFSLNRTGGFPQPANHGPIYNSTSIKLELPYWPDISSNQIQQEQFITNLDNNFITSLMWGDISNSSN